MVASDCSIISARWLTLNYYQILNVKRGWRKIPHTVFYDEALTSDAKVVMSELLSVSGEYHISEAGIAKSLHLSLERTKKAIRLLKSTGYIQISHIKDGTRFGGCEWRISDTKGTFQQTENPSSGNQATENPTDGDSSRWETERMESQQTENPSKYINTERYQRQNNQEEEYQRPKEYQLPLQQRAVEEDAESLPSNPPSFITVESSSEANASPLPGKNSCQPEVLDQREYQYQQFLKKYPKAPLVKDRKETREAFFEATALDGSFAEIMAGLDAWCRSAEWRKDNGRWIKKPVNWLKERQWEKIETPGAYREWLNTILPDEEDDYEAN